MDALLAFAATLVTLRLSADLLRRYRARRAPAFAAWAAGLGAYALAAAALAWGAAYGWNGSSFRVYYLAGALCTAALLGTGSLLLAGWRWMARVAFVYVGLAVGVAVAVPLAATPTGTEIPDAQEVLDLWPARTLAIVGNSLGTLAVVAVAVATLRARPVGNALVLAGIAVAAVGSGLAGLGIGALAPAIVVAALLLYAGFVAPSSLTKPHRHEQRDDAERHEALDDGARHSAVGDYPRESTHRPPTV